MKIILNQWCNTGLKKVKKQLKLYFINGVTHENSKRVKILKNYTLSME